jgi:fructose-1,6-bisphosphatase/inositol monophosphatase family enzyme
LHVLTGVLQNSQPAAACVVEFAGGPGTWVTRTYTAIAGGGAHFNGQRISASSCSSIAQSLLVGSGAPAIPLLMLGLSIAVLLVVLHRPAGRRLHT